MQSNTQHEFALFSLELSAAIAQKKTILTISESSMVHRLQHVLRLQVGEQVVLFDDVVHVRCTVTEYAKSRATLTIVSVEKNQPVLPSLTVILPLLKREALDECIYACREMGVTAVYLVSTDKSSRHSVSPAERERLERVSIAAAEQSKNFSPCQLIVGAQKNTLPTLSELCEQSKDNPHFSSALKLFADSTGKHFSEIIPTITPQKTSIVVCVGPEGDLTPQEKQVLHFQGFIFCQLGATILRAQQAATVLIGLIRALT